MKVFLLLFSFGILTMSAAFTDEDNIFSIANQKSNTPSTVKVIFDGYEGGQYFFTNEQNKAVVITNDALLPSNVSNLQNGAFVGKRFEIDIDKINYKEDSEQSIP